MFAVILICVDANIIFLAYFIVPMKLLQHVL